MESCEKIKKVNQMKNCKNCRSKKCSYRYKAFKNMTIYCSERCPLEIKRECETIATPEFRAAMEQLKQGSYKIGSVKGILKQAEVILNAADDIFA